MKRTRRQVFSFPPVAAARVSVGGSSIISRITSSHFGRGDMVRATGVVLVRHYSCRSRRPLMQNPLRELQPPPPPQAVAGSCSAGDRLETVEQGNGRGKVRLSAKAGGWRKREFYPMLSGYVVLPVCIHTRVREVCSSYSVVENVQTR